MTFRLINEYPGYLQPGQVSAVEAVPLGTEEAVYDPTTFGGGTAIFVKALTTIPVWQSVVLTPTFNATTLRYELIASAVPNTTNQSRPIAIVMQRMVSGDYGWVLVSGCSPVSATASVAAAAPFGVAAAGQLGAAAAGKNVFGAVSIAASSVTVVKAGCSGRAGDNKIRVPNCGGLFVGQLASGTGVAALAIVTAIDEINNEVTVAVVNTLSTISSVTFTNNDATIHYPTAQFNRPTLSNITV